MIAQKKQEEIEQAAWGVLERPAVDPDDVRAIEHALRRVHEPLIEDSPRGIPGHAVADVDLMYTVLVQRINRYRPNNHIYLKDTN